MKLHFFIPLIVLLGILSVSQGREVTHALGTYEQGLEHAQIDSATAPVAEHILDWPDAKLDGTQSEVTYEGLEGEIDGERFTYSLSLKSTSGRPLITFAKGSSLMLGDGSGSQKSFAVGNGVVVSVHDISNDKIAFAGFDRVFMANAKAGEGFIINEKPHIKEPNNRASTASELQGNESSLRLLATSEKQDGNGWLHLRALSYSFQRKKYQGIPEPTTYPLIFGLWGLTWSFATRPCRRFNRIE